MSDHARQEAVDERARIERESLANELEQLGKRMDGYDTQLKILAATLETQGGLVKQLQDLFATRTVQRDGGPTG